MITIRCPECRAYIHTPPMLLPDDDTAVERLRDAIKTSDYRHDTARALAEWIVSRLREGGPR